MDFRTFRNIGIVNTLRMNVHYFGWRSLLHPYILASRDLKILKLGGEVKIEQPSVGCIRIGLGECGIVDHRYDRSVWENYGLVKFKAAAHIGVGMRIYNDGVLTIGENCDFNAYSDILCRKQITFGDSCLMSWECLIMDTDFHDVMDADSGEVLNPDRGITFGSHVWIGSRCTILKGSILPDHSVIAACSLVTGALNENHCVYASNRVLRRNADWKS